MTFKDLIKIDQEHAYSDWMSVREAKYYGDIPEKYFPYFDDYCECGSENIIKHGLTQMTCSDPNCPIKQGYAIAEMLTRFGVKGLKEATCRKIYEAFKRKDEKEKFLKTKSYVELLTIPWEDYPASVQCSAKGLEFFQACQFVHSKQYTFSELVAALAIPSLGNDAEKLLGGISNVEVMLNTIKEEGSVSRFCSKRGFKAPMVAFNLRHSLTDIAVANLIFNHAIRQEGVFRVSVCMTGAVSLHGNRTTKEQFLKQCNELCIDKDGLQLMEFKMNAAIESNPFILYSRPSGDRKFVAGTKRGVISDAFGTHEVLMKTDDFYDYLERVMTKWNSEKSGDSEKNTTLLLKLLPEVMKELQPSENQLEQMQTF